MSWRADEQLTSGWRFSQPRRIDDAKAVIEHWPDDGTYSVEHVEFQGKTMFYVIAIRDEDDGDIIGLL